MTIKVKYKMECGCFLPRVKTVRFQKTISCPKHKKRFIQKLFKCIDCNCWHEAPGNGRTPDRCGECRTTHEKKKAHDWHIANRKGVFTKGKKKRRAVWKSAAFQYDPRGDYCRTVETCSFSKVLNCDGCLSFRGWFPGVDPGKSLFC